MEWGNVQLELREDEKYYFDAAAADKAVHFIGLLKHWEDRWEGSAFRLAGYQEKATRDLFGWKRRDTHRRRFRECFALIGKGNGKSAWLSAIGCYMLLADGEAAAHVISAATDFKQANLTFEWARNSMLLVPRLKKLIDPKQFQIKAPNNSKWTIVSGTVQGQAGAKPTCLLLDELWEAPNRKLYDSLTRNAKKRSQSLVIVASNAGTSRQTICYELYERAKRVLNGESKDDTLYPIIFEASEKDDAGSIDTWRKANPALGEIITIETLQDEWIKAKENPGLHDEFCRLHLSRWVGSTHAKFIDMDHWQRCTSSFTADQVKDLPLVLALDMSLNDDLTALAMIWIGTDKLYVRCKFWLPRKTAEEYEQRDSIPFRQWAGGIDHATGEKRHGYIRLVDADTIDPATQASIAQTIQKIATRYKVSALTYDQARASNVIAMCERHGIKSIPIPQNYKLSPAAEELSRRLKDGSIAIAPNPVLKWNAGNAECKVDHNGNLHIIKSGRSGEYKGRRGDKIDGIAALVTGLSQVRLELMNPPTPKVSVYESRGVLVA